MNDARKASANYQKSGDGGGALVVFENMQGTMNLVILTGCQFTSNSATHGGGMTIVSHLPPNMVEAGCTQSLVKIHGCTFSMLTKLIMALALYLHRISSNYGSDPWCAICQMLEFLAMFLQMDQVPSTGVVYAYFSSLRLSGNLNFTGNSDTVLFLIGSQAACL